MDKSIGRGPESLTTKDSLTEPGSSTDQTGRNPVTGNAPGSSLQSIINTIAPIIGFGSSTGGGQEPRSNDSLYDAGNASGELIKILDTGPRFREIGLLTAFRLGDKGLSTDDPVGGATAGIANLTTRDSASAKPQTVQNESVGESSSPGSSVGTKDHGPSKNSDGLLSQFSTSGNSSAASYGAGSTESQPTTAKKTASFPDSQTPELPNLASDSSRYEKPSSIGNSRPDSDIADLNSTASNIPGTSTSHTVFSTTTPSFLDSTKPQAATSLGESESQVISDPSSGQKSGQKQQGADRPLEEPVGKQSDALAKDKAHAERAQARGSIATYSPLIPGLPSDDKRGSPADAETENSLVTGEKYVKSTGTAAQGGNFDAAAPGAGKEADRE